MHTGTYYVVVGWGYNSEHVRLETTCIKEAYKECQEWHQGLTEEEFEDFEHRAHILVEADDGDLVEYGNAY